MSDAVLRDYLRKIEKIYQTNNATEHTYRSTLEELLRAFDPTVIATNEPKRIRCGAPDFIVTRKQTPLGYMETKDIGISLDQTERSDQMKRYLGSLANLILTDYLEFRWYVAKEHRMTARLARVGTKGRWIPDTDGIEQVSKLLQGFLVTQTPTVNNPKELATRMASIAQLIRNAITLAFKSEEGGGSLHGQLVGFKQVLLPDLDAEHFADMYAQTISYGLFAARASTKPGATFTREYAAFHMPKSNPFLGKMFGYIAGPDLDERIVWAVDDLAEVLNRTDMEAILKDFGKRTRQEDPVVHFYETFLAAYDPKMRESRGVYYTPEPVVSYIVRSVDHLLKESFSIADGLADATKIVERGPDGKLYNVGHKVQILDPATGTATFLHSVIDLIYETFKGNKGIWSSYVSEHLLPRLFGFELLMAPYTVAHMKLGLQLAEMGYEFKGKERLGVYLTNTLEEGFEGEKLPFVEWLVEEATAAGNVRHDNPVMVVLGNPPYSKHSANKGKWITELLHNTPGNYFEVDGEPLGERNPKWLNNDYVKFIRFAQWRIERTGYGILAFITGHGYIDNPTFRGMRQSLMRTFDEIYILDLHGNSKKNEQSLDGSKDENIFDIQQGVAISIFVKHLGSNRKVTQVYHAHLWGSRQAKYDALFQDDITTTSWNTLKPQTPSYLFVPQGNDLSSEYENCVKVTEVFPVYSGGIGTSRDDFTIRFNEEEVWNTVNRFITLPIEEARDLFDLGKDARDWKVSFAQKDIKATGPSRKYLTTILYRPFDIRYTYYTGKSRGFHVNPRYEVMRHMQRKNLAFLTHRPQSPNDFTYAFCSQFIPDQCVAANKSSGGGNSYVFPLYLYSEPSIPTLFTMEDVTIPVEEYHKPNLSESFVTIILEKLNMQFIPTGKGDLHQNFGPEDIFDYMYAVFYSPTYRERYAEFLRIDFPRLPLTSNSDLFRELCKLGERLVALHLMEKFGKATPHYPEEGNNTVEKVEYLASADQPDRGRIYINKTQYFDGVPSEVWEFHVGGYQVCQKWLKDRKGRSLSFDDIKHYQRIVAALTETIELMEKIDEVIEDHGGWPIE